MNKMVFFFTFHQLKDGNENVTGINSLFKRIVKNPYYKFFKMCLVYVLHTCIISHQPRDNDNKGMRTNFPYFTSICCPEEF